uniref:Uncharacterized protein n=1 Tax=Athene cunicularia TaxID=194338 RepID=A0A663MQG3_ATHCN
MWPRGPPHCGHPHGQGTQQPALSALPCHTNPCQAPTAAESLPPSALALAHCPLVSSPHGPPFWGACCLQTCAKAPRKDAKPSNARSALLGAGVWGKLAAPPPACVHAHAGACLERDEMLAGGCTARGHQTWGVVGHGGWNRRGPESPQGMRLPCPWVQGLVLTQRWVAGSSELGTSNATMPHRAHPAPPVSAAGVRFPGVGVLPGVPTGAGVKPKGPGRSPPSPGDTTVEGGSGAGFSPSFGAAASQGTWASEANLRLSPHRLVWTLRTSLEVHTGAFVFLPRSRSLRRNPW